MAVYLVQGPEGLCGVPAGGDLRPNLLQTDNLNRSYIRDVMMIARFMLFKKHVRCFLGSSIFYILSYNNMTSFLGLYWITGLSYIQYYAGFSVWFVRYPAECKWCGLWINIFQNIFSLYKIRVK